MLTQAPRPLAVSQEEKESYERDGFLLKKGLLTSEWVARLDEETASLHERMANDKPDESCLASEQFYPSF